MVRSAQQQQIDFLKIWLDAGPPFPVVNSDAAKPPIAAMRIRLRELLTWFVLPLTAAALARLYYAFFAQALAIMTHARDPRSWTIADWFVQLGPLSGFAFLAGATQPVRHDDGFPKKPLAHLARSPVLWLAVGPWIGFLVYAALLTLLHLLNLSYSHITGQSLEMPSWSPPEPWSWIVAVAWFGLTLCYAWIWVALPLCIQSRRAGRLGTALRDGFLTLGIFLATLFGGFWTLTEAFREFFFDKRLAPFLVLTALSCVAAAGCAAPETLGDVRRRDLFEALLVAWVAGLALIWRWGRRPRRRR